MVSLISSLLVYDLIKVVYTEEAASGCCHPHLLTLINSILAQLMMGTAGSLSIRTYGEAVMARRHLAFKYQEFLRTHWRVFRLDKTTLCWSKELSKDLGALAPTKRSKGTLYTQWWKPCTGPRKIILPTYASDFIP